MKNVLVFVFKGPFTILLFLSGWLGRGKLESLQDLLPG
jgi:hypothetical protein